MLESLFIEVFLLRPATLLKKRPFRSSLPVNIAKVLKILFFVDHLRWLLLKMIEEFLRPCLHLFNVNGFIYQLIY